MSLIVIILATFGLFITTSLLLGLIGVVYAKQLDNTLLADQGMHPIDGYPAILPERTLAATTKVKEAVITPSEEEILTSKSIRFASSYRYITQALPFYEGLLMEARH